MAGPFHKILLFMKRRPDLTVESILGGVGLDARLVTTHIADG